MVSVAANIPDTKIIKNILGQCQRSEEHSMSNELEFLSRRVAAGKLSRRDFLGRAAALGIAAPFANTLLSNAARAAGPVKGGTIKAGLVGGESTNSLDPALMMTQVPFAFGKCWGEMIVELS